MLRARFILPLISAIALVTVAVSLAHAGGANGKKFPVQTFVCKAIQNGANPPQVVNVKEPGASNPVLGTVQVNAPAFLCEGTPVLTAVVTADGPDIDSNLSSADNTVVCYLTSQFGRVTKEQLKVETPFFEEDMVTNGYGLLCVPAVKH